MIKYILKRIMLMGVVLFAVLLIIFFITRTLPGDPVAMWVGEHPTQEQLEYGRKILGFDQPITVQFLKYFKGLLHGDLGMSLRTQQPVTMELANRFAATFELVTIALILAILLGYPMGLYAAYRSNSLADKSIRITGYMGIAMPIFWLGMLLQLIFFGVLGWLPLQGRVTGYLFAEANLPVNSGLFILDSLISGNGELIIDILSHIFLPAITLAFAVIGIVIRVSRSAMLESMLEPHFTTFLTYGFTPFQILKNLMYKNTLIPTVTVIGMSYGLLLGGTFLVESIFDWPGLGQFGVLSILTNDFPSIIGVTLIYAGTYIFLNFVIDILYFFLDPRVRL
ncbi:MAG: ABC transporter permease [Candidatus Marinimicrobia bacterium]|nr:ABC transporter permease [Candidatus Neomarinimicrobiota bacterium]